MGASGGFILCFYGKLYLYGLVDAIWELVEALLGSIYAIRYKLKGAGACCRGLLEAIWKL